MNQKKLNEEIKLLTSKARALKEQQTQLLRRDAIAQKAKWAWVKRWIPYVSKETTSAKLLFVLAATDPKLVWADFPKKFKLTGEQWLQVFEKKIQKETKLLKLNKSYEKLSQEDLNRIEKEEIKKLKELFELAGIVPPTQNPSLKDPVTHEDLVGKLTEGFQEKVKNSKNLPSPEKEKITNKIESALELFKPGEDIERFIKQLRDDPPPLEGDPTPLEELKTHLDALLKPDESQKEIFEVYNQFHPATAPQEEAVKKISDTMAKLFLPGGESHVAQY